MSDGDHEEDERKRTGKKKDHKPAPEPDKSTPHSDDYGLVAWIARLFRDDERALNIFVKQLLGRDGKLEGNVVKTVPFATKPTQEQSASIANEMLEEMQNEANSHRKARMFALVANNPQKGGDFARRTITVEPTKLTLNGASRGEEYDEDNPLYGHGGDKLLKRVEVILADGRWHSEQQTQTFGGFAQLLTEENKELRSMVKELMTGWLEMAKAKNAADNNALDREVIRNREAFKLEIQRQGVNTLQNFLLPEAGKIANKVLAPTPAPTNGAANGDARAHGDGAKTPLAPGRQLPPDVAAILRVMTALTDGEKVRIFGAWTDEGARTQAGILDEGQVRIIVGVLKEEIHPDSLDSLLQGQGNEISDSQKFAIAGVASVEKFKPLLALMQERKAKLDAAARPSA